MAAFQDDDPVLDLGMLEESPAWKLSSRFLVHSKVGGRPAWLQPTDLPDPADLLCTHCKTPMVFLAQLYAPVENKESAFHRTVFVFMCKQPGCHSSETTPPPFVVFRNQLSRINRFYPFDAPPEVADWRPELIPGKFSSLCRICGCSGSKKCAGCKKVAYCSKDHQTADWKLRHKAECSDPKFERDVIQEDTEVNAFNLPQWEIVMHEDDEPDSSSSDENESEGEEDDDKNRENAELKKYQELVQQGKAGTLPTSEVEKYAGDAEEDAGKKDKVFEKFLRVTKRAPKQVVRYSRGGKPLWVSDKEMAENVPSCEFCNGPRIFEFQIMPQLLASLKLDELNESSVDWGTLAVYTCQNSCDKSPAYKKEYLWRQNITQHSSV